MPIQQEVPLLHVRDSSITFEEASHGVPHQFGWLKTVLIECLCSKLSFLQIDWYRMCFCIKNKFIQRNKRAVSKQQVQILQRFSQKEGLHFVSLDRRNSCYIAQRTIPTTLNPRIFLKSFKYLPTPFSVSIRKKIRLITEKTRKLKSMLCFLQREL